MSARVFHALMVLGWLWLALAGGARAQSYSVSYEQLGLWEMGLVDTDEDEIPDTPFYYIAWNAKAGRTYFIQMSDDMMNWTMVPAIEAGSGQYAYWAAAMTAERRFLRLLYTDQAAPHGALGSDFDADGINNETEITVHGTNPLMGDTDGDGFGDGLEVAYLSSPLSAASQPPYELEIIRGQGQVTVAGEPLFQRLTVRVRQVGILRADVPVMFAVANGDGVFGLDGSGGSTTSIATNATGEAAVAFVTDPETIGPGVITAQATAGHMVSFSYSTVDPAAGGGFGGGGGGSNSNNWANYFRLEHRSASGSFTNETGTVETKTVPFVFEWNGSEWISEGPGLGFQWALGTGTPPEVESYVNEGGVSYSDGTSKQASSASAVSQAVNAVASSGSNGGWLPALSASGVFSARTSSIDRTEGGLAPPSPPPDPPEGTPEGYLQTEMVSADIREFDGSSLSQSAGEWRLAWADFAEPNETATMSFVVIKETQEEGEQAFNQDSCTIQTITLPPSQPNSEPLKANPQPAGDGETKRERVNGVILRQVPLTKDGVRPFPSGVMAATSSPRMARWHTAFDNQGALQPNWIDTDFDRVEVDLPLDALHPDHKEVKLLTSGISGPGAVAATDNAIITSPQGVLKPFILVVDEVDGDVYNGSGPDGGAGDQTLRASLGCQIKVRFRLRGAAEDQEVVAGKVAAASKKVEVQLNVLKIGQRATADAEQRAQQWYEKARLLYRQAGFNLVKKGDTQVVPLPQGYADFIEAENYIWDSTQLNVTSGQAFMDYLAAQSPKQSYIKMYFIETDIHGAHAGLGWTDKRTLGGVIQSCYSIVEVLENENSSIQKGAAVVAHELGHAMGAGHSGQNMNHTIMLSPMVESPPSDHLAPRRFKEVDQDSFKTSSYPQAP